LGQEPTFKVNTFFRSETLEVFKLLNLIRLDPLFVLEEILSEYESRWIHVDLANNYKLNTFTTSEPIQLQDGPSLFEDLKSVLWDHSVGYAAEGLTWSFDLLVEC
jgi:hypothetical protein